MTSFVAQKFLALMMSNLSVFFLLFKKFVFNFYSVFSSVARAFGVIHVRIFCHIQGHEDLPLCFLAR